MPSDLDVPLLMVSDNPSRCLCRRLGRRAKVHESDS